MQTRMRDFCGDVEWFCVSDRLEIDQTYRSLDDLIHISLQDIEALAGIVRDKPIDPDEQVPLLRSLLSSMGSRYEQLYIADRKGDYFNADGQLNNVADRAYFHHVLRGQTVISEPIINKSTKMPCIAVAAPIWNGREVIGLFGATILIDSRYEGLRFLPSMLNQKRISEKKRARRGRVRIGAKNRLFRAA